MEGIHHALHSVLHFDIDSATAPYVPKSVLHHLPRPISHFLGYRPRPTSPLPPLLTTLRGSITIFLALLCVASINTFTPLSRLAFPPIPPSLGAGAVLNFLLLANPGSQPRPTIIGQIISATVATGIGKAFVQVYGSHANQLYYLSAPLACALAAMAMRLTNTVHPPGGATAILVVTTPELRDLGWNAVACIALGTTVMVGVGCVCNNVGEKWPAFWWTSEETGSWWADRRRGGAQSPADEKDRKVGGKDEESGSLDPPEKSADTNSHVEHGRASDVGSNLTAVTSRADSQRTAATASQDRCPCCGRS